MHAHSPFALITPFDAIYRACTHYWDAKLLVECVLLSASEPADKRVLQGYAKMFLDQFVVCEKSSTLLDYSHGGVSIGGRSFEHKSPGSYSSFDSQVSHHSMGSNTNQVNVGNPAKH